MESLLLEEIKESFNSVELELSRLDLDIIQMESTLSRCEKYSFGWHQQFIILRALKERQNLTRTKLASLAVDLSNEKTRMGL